MCMCAVVIAALFICLAVFAALHLSSGPLYSSSNCHWSDCSSLDAMEAVIGHPRLRDQCHRYYRDLRHLWAPDSGPSRGQRGTGRGGRGDAPQLVMPAQRPDNCLSRCLSTARGPTCICSLHPAHWHLPSTESVFGPHPISHPASLTGLLLLRFSCCHTRPVRGSYCVQGIPALQTFLRSASRFILSSKLLPVWLFKTSLCCTAVKAIIISRERTRWKCGQALTTASRFG